MDVEPPLDYLLNEQGASGPSPGREELAAIVARSRGQRRRMAAWGMAATLLAGAAVGWAAGLRSQPSRSATVAAPQPASNGADSAAASAGTATAADGGGVAGVALGGPKLHKEFARTTADGVTVRAYQTSFDGAVPAGCPAPVPGLVVEVSTAEVAGQAFGWTTTSTAPFTELTESLVGVAEGAPVWVVSTRTGATVAQVRAQFADGQADQMAPVDGWAALAHLVPPESAASAASGTTPAGTIQALDAGGKVLGTVTLPTLSQLMPPGKILPAPAAGGATGSKPAVAPPPDLPGNSSADSGPVTKGPTTGQVPVPPCKILIPPVPSAAPATK